MSVQENHFETHVRPSRCLAAQEIERLEGFRIGDSIVCTRGLLWITQEQDPEDYVLEKGQVFVANRAGLVLAQALKGPACRFYRRDQG